MSDIPRGIWIWRLAKIQPDYLDKLVGRGAKRVYLKVFDGKSSPMFWGFQCNAEVIGGFRDRGIEVYGWGYHYGTENDIAEQVAAVQMALDTGVDGYVLDVEVEVEKPANHSNVKNLLDALRKVVKAGKLGYTSFGHPGFHPKVPWKMLDEVCDFALPQIYFEKWSFKPTSEEKVQDCLDAHAALDLKKPLWPIWGSESDTKNPASAAELQSYLDRFAGSSVWRAPNAGERGEALKLRYGGHPTVMTGDQSIPKLPKLTRLLKRRSQGKDVKALQTALKARGFDIGELDGDFGSKTERGVRTFQLQTGLTVDGLVGPDTWAALGGDAETARPELGKLSRIADIAQAEAAKQLVWLTKDSEAEKYLQPFREPMRKLGQIGSKPVFFNWCASFVTWCCREAGIRIPEQPDGFWATMAKVEAWKYWAQKAGFWHAKGTVVPQRGDIVVFEWFDEDVELDHIGVVRGYAEGSQMIQTSEGNRGNRSVNGDRNLINVQGIIRIAE